MIFSNREPQPSGWTDIVARLRAMKAPGVLDNSLLLAAANEIERLRSAVRRLEELKTPKDQFDAGYSSAQRDIRSALGIED